MKNKKLVPYDRSLHAKAPHLRSQWHPTKNGSTTSKDVFAGSAKKVWWQCGKGHEWEARILNRVHGRGCPGCSRRDLHVATDYHLLGESPGIAAEWHPSLNGSLTPELISPRSGRKVWWQCGKGHEWEATIYNRVRHKSGCPFCSNRRATPDYNLAVFHPSIAKEWHPSKNQSLEPSQVLPGSGKKVWWKCPVGHEYEAIIGNRTRLGTGCRFCTHTSSSMELRIFAELQAFFPDALSRFRIEKRELDIYLPTLKLGLEFDGVYWHQEKETKDRNKSQFFKERGIRLLRIRQKPLPRIESQDVLVGTEYLTKQDVDRVFVSIKEFTGITSLDPYFLESDFVREPEFREYLSNTITAAPERSLAERFPQLVAEWDFEKNEPLKPTQFSVGSDHPAWWKCDEGHSWQAVISSRANSRSVGCPFCKGKLPTESNNLAALYPQIAADWNYAKNKGKKPSEFLPQSHSKVWWRCAKEPGHEWQASISNRVGSKRRKGTGCPECHKTRPYERKPIEYEKSLAAKYPALAREWDTKMNVQLTPADLSPGSNVKVFWRCGKGHVWPATIKNRVHGRGCPDCKWNRKGGKRIVSESEKPSS